MRDRRAAFWAAFFAGSEVVAAGHAFVVLLPITAKASAVVDDDSYANRDINDPIQLKRRPEAISPRWQIASGGRKGLKKGDWKSEKKSGRKGIKDRPQLTSVAPTLA